MQETEKLSREQIQAFLEASVEVQVEGQNRAEIYAWINTLLRQHDYEQLDRGDKGLPLRFMEDERL